MTFLLFSYTVLNILLQGMLKFHVVYMHYESILHTHTLQILLNYYHKTSIEICYSQGETGTNRHTIVKYEAVWKLKPSNLHFILSISRQYTKTSLFGGIKWEYHLFLLHHFLKRSISFNKPSFINDLDLYST